jgi:hypothetical protein
MLWDRKNQSLSNHFYGHNNINHKLLSIKNNYAIIVETENINSFPYTYAMKNSCKIKEFIAIFTHSEKLLNKYENARFIPAGGVWYGIKKFGGSYNEKAYENKENNISIVSSNKKYCELHRIRIEVAKYLERNNLADTFGNFNGGNKIKISDSLEKYRYSIVIENTIDAYCFTEKILNCFASMTVPIYLGATKINEYFNIDGIITIDKNDLKYNIEKIIKSCTEVDYESRIEAIIENYTKVLEYSCQEDYMLKKYPNLFPNNN